MTEADLEEDTRWKHYKLKKIVDGRNDIDEETKQEVIEQSRRNGKTYRK